MEVIFHPEASSDVREIALRYADVSERAHEAFWAELDLGIKHIGKRPRTRSFDESGMRRFNLQRYPYHLLYVEEGEQVVIVVVRHDKRHPMYGIDRRT